MHWLLTELALMKLIKIVNCSDSRMWYKNLIGQFAVYLGEYEDEYLSKEPAGYTNIIFKNDAELIETDKE